MMRISFKHPNELTAIELQVLTNALTNTRSSWLEKDTRYDSHYHDENNTYHRVTCQFSNDIIKRKCNKHGKHQAFFSDPNGKFRFEVICKSAFAKGTHGNLYEIKCTIALPHAGKPIQIKTHKNRVVKIQKLNEENLDFILSEYEQTPPHVGMKRLVTYLNISFLVMRDMGEQDLLSLLNKDRREKFLSDFDRFNLCILITQALLNQVHKENTVHRDLKAENIMVTDSAKLNSWVINIIDFGLSKKSDLPDNHQALGTLEFVSPEILNKQGSTFKSDIYALGCIFSMIFGGIRSQKFNISIEKSFAQIKEEQDNNHICLDKLFSNIKEMDIFPKNEIQKLIVSMTRTNPDDRPIHEEIINQLVSCKNNYEDFYDLKYLSFEEESDDSSQDPLSPRK